MFENENVAKASAMFGKYDIIQTIGQGGMSVVYLAQDTSLDRVIALKILKDDLRTNDNVVARFQREAEAYATLNHPNIVEIYSVGSIGRIPYIAMEYIEGDPLSRVMKRKRRIPWPEALAITKHIAQALACAHEAQIIHRDIKPGNILVGKNGKIYVTDFGIAKVLTAETQLTIDGSRLGTPHYMSPERCQNKEITPSSDIYSLGVLVFQMISGRLPYEAPTPVSLIRKITADPPARLHQYVADIPANVERLVAFLLEKDPKHRPATGAELVNLIERVEKGKPLVEDESRLGDALQELRGSIPTPPPGSSFHTDTTGLDKKRSKHVSLADRWAALTENIRAVLLTLPLIVVAVVAGLFFTTQLNEGYVSEAIRNAQPAADRWQQSGSVATIIDESPGVAVARIDLPDFSAIAGHAFPAGGSVFVQLDGNLRSPRRGQTALVIMDPVAGEVRLAIPPVQASVPFRFAPAYELQFGYAAPPPPVLYPAEIEIGRGERQAAILEWDFQRANATPRYTATQLARGQGTPSRIPQAFGAIAVSPTGSSITVACTETNALNSWFLLHRSTDAVGETTNSDITKPGPRINSVHYSPDGTWLAYTREQRQGLVSLRTVDLRNEMYTETLLAQGDLSFLPGGISPYDGTIVASLSSAAGERTLEMYDPFTGKLGLEIGKGESAVWHPSGNSLVAVAPDRKGKRQLWLIDARAPYARTQLTYLNAGTSAMCIVSRDGRWAISSVADADTPSIVFAGIAGIPSRRR